MFTYKTVFSAFFKALARYSRNKIWCKNYKGGQKRANLIFIFPLRCIVEYCYVVWHSSITVHQNNALERIQRLLLCCRALFSHSSPKQCPWTDTESLPKNYSRQRLCWIYKCIGVLRTEDPGVKKGLAISLLCKEMY